MSGVDVGGTGDDLAGDVGSTGSVHERRARAALDNLFIGDALAMPVHWYYNPGDILRAFPPHGIRRMEAAPEHHPSSIMPLHSTRGGGRSARRGGARARPGNGHAGSAEPEIVGDVILKGRRALWGRSNGHYHHGLPAGENTLNAWWARRLLVFLAERGGYDRRAWAEDYIAFMTADPPAHPDTYAESCHRGFFANLVAGRDPLDCGAVTHDTPSMGALVTVAPLALALLAEHPLEDVVRTCREHVRLTHPDEGLLAVVDAYVVLMARLVARPENAEDAAELVDAFVEAAAVIPGTRLRPLLDRRGGDAAVVGGTYSLACYIDDSWPSVCYLAAKYAAEPERALLVNVNLGGENAHRGAVLGTLLGLVAGRSPDALRSQLHRGTDIENEIDALIARFPGRADRPRRPA